MFPDFNLKYFLGRQTEEVLAIQDESLENQQVVPEENTSTQEFLGKHGIKNDSISAQSTDVEVTFLDDFLSPDAVKSPQDTFSKAELDHRLSLAELEHRQKLRRWILRPLIIPMAIIPIWLMVLLSVPVFNSKATVSERMQIAYLGAVASDFIGLYYIITRDLFPNGGNKRKQKGDDN